MDPAAAGPAVHRRLRDLQSVGQVVEPPFARLQSMAGGLGGGPVAVVKNRAAYPVVESVALADNLSLLK
jgi:hypothetical protein